MTKIITVSFDLRSEGFVLDIQSSDKADPTTAQELELLIQALARVRESIYPPVMLEVPELAGLQALSNDPTWFGAYDQANDRVALVLRHPGYAWVGYALSPASAQQLRECLDRISLQRTASTGNIH